MARGLFHEAVRQALEKDGWIITHDPYLIRLLDLALDVDLGAERTLAAERGIGSFVERLPSKLKRF